MSPEVVQQAPACSPVEEVTGLDFGLGSGHRSATFRVWLLASVGLLAGAILIGVDEYLSRHIVERHQAASTAAATISRRVNSLDLSLEQARAELTALLDSDSHAPTAGTRTLEDLEASTEALARLGEFGPQVSALPARMATLHRDAQQWRGDLSTARQERGAAEVQIASSLDALRTAINARAGRQRLRDAIEVRRLLQLEGEAAHLAALDFARGLTTTGKDHGLGRELGEVRLLTQELLARPNADLLGDLKDNRLSPGLRRLRAEILQTAAGDDGQPALDIALLDAFETALFGSGFTRGARHQTIELGRGGAFLAIASTLELDQRRGRQLLSAAEVHAQYEDLRAVLHEHTTQRVTGVATAIDEAIRTARLRALPVIGLTVAVFLYLARRVARTLRAQMQQLQDISRRVLLAREDLELTQRAFPSGLIGFDAQLCITSINKRARILTGAARGALIGRSIRDYNLEWERPRVEAAILRCIQQRTQQRIAQLPFRADDGHTGTFEITLNPKLGKDGELHGVLLVATDIQERLDLEAQLSQAHKLESIGQLAAGIAHEINTPTQYTTDNVRFLSDAADDLLGVIGAAAAIVEAEELESSAHPAEVAALKLKLAEADMEFLTDEIPKALEQSLEGLTTVAGIVRAMKEFSHPGQTEKVQVDLNRTIENSVTVARNEWRYVAELELHPDPTLPPVPCVQGEFNQVILNIVVNAAHAIAAKLGPDSTEKGHISVTTSCTEDWAEVRITDDGCGMPPAVRERIFDPFFTTKELGQGTGQGLAIARSVIVDKHQGQLQVESTEGQGTTFIIQLPLSPSGSQTAADETVTQ